MQLTSVELDSPIEPTSVPLRWVLEGLDDAQYERWDELRRFSAPVGVSCTPISGAGFLSDVLRVRLRFEDGREFAVILKCKGVMLALADFHAFTLLLPDSQNVIETLQNEMDDYNEEKWRLSENLQKLDPFFVEHKAEIDRLIRENHAQVRDPHRLFVQMLEIYRFHRRHEILFATFILGIGTTKNATDEERRAAVERLRISYERVLPELDADERVDGRENGHVD
ncbi:hypothetical protein M3Y99_01558800 [Aphelenchoides fujianensis]|nr:hypothetical protein M3Y99_01558800 [Aphelenchoides fujianensis]